MPNNRGCGVSIFTLTIATVWILYIVRIHIRREQILLVCKLIAEIESERKPICDLCSLLIRKEMAVCIIEHLLERCCAHNLWRNFVCVLYPWTFLG